jgi:hypothetical protein
MAENNNENNNNDLSDEGTPNHPYGLRSGTPANSTEVPVTVPTTAQTAAPPAPPPPPPPAAVDPIEAAASHKKKIDDAFFLYEMLQEPVKHMSFFQEHLQAAATLRSDAVSILEACRISGEFEVALPQLLQILHQMTMITDDCSAALARYHSISGSNHTPSPSPNSSLSSQSNTTSPFTGGVPPPNALPPSNNLGSPIAGGPAQILNPPTRFPTADELRNMSHRVVLAAPNTSDAMLINQIAQLECTSCVNKQSNLDMRKHIICCAHGDGQAAIESYMVVAAHCVKGLGSMPLNAHQPGKFYAYYDKPFQQQQDNNATKGATAMLTAQVQKKEELILPNGKSLAATTATHDLVYQDNASHRNDIFNKVVQHSHVHQHWDAGSNTMISTVSSELHIMLLRRQVFCHRLLAITLALLESYNESNDKEVYHKCQELIAGYSNKTPDNIIHSSFQPIDILAPQSSLEQLVHSTFKGSNTAHAMISHIMIATAHQSSPQFICQLAETWIQSAPLEFEDHPTGTLRQVLLQQSKDQIKVPDGGVIDDWIPVYRTTEALCKFQLLMAHSMLDGHPPTTKYEKKLVAWYNKSTAPDFDGDFSTMAADCTLTGFDQAQRCFAPETIARSRLTSFAGAAYTQPNTNNTKTRPRRDVPGGGKGAADVDQPDSPQTIANKEHWSLHNLQMIENIFKGPVSSWKSAHFVTLMGKDVAALFNITDSSITLKNPNGKLHSPTGVGKEKKKLDGTTYIQFMSVMELLAPLGTFNRWKKDKYGFFSPQQQTKYDKLQLELSKSPWTAALRTKRDYDRANDPNPNRRSNGTATSTSSKSGN